MAQPQMKIEGFDDLKKAFNTLKQKSRRKVLRSVIRKAARPVMTAAKKNLDVRDRTGQLRKNIAITVTAKNDEVAIADVGMRRKQFYGGFFEVGTAFIRPRPWLRPALYKSKSTVVARFAKALKVELMKATRR